MFVRCTRCFDLFGEQSKKLVKCLKFATRVKTVLGYFCQMHQLFFGKSVQFDHKAVIAEWLSRLTRNQMGSSRAGSYPADCVALFDEHSKNLVKCLKFATRAKEF